MQSQAIARIEQVVQPEVKTEKVWPADFFPTSPESQDDIDEALDNLREHLAKLLAEGVKIVLQ